MRYLIFLATLVVGLVAEPAKGGWGVDVAVGCPILKGAALEANRAQLESADLQWLRGRGFSAGEQPELPPQTGWFGRYSIIGFAGDDSLKPQEGDQLPRDLVAVYLTAKAQAAFHRGRIRAWEMVGEPDVGYCRDLPDRLAAYQKAQYLGLRDGDPEAVVLMGALALPPGPWLERAKRNRLLDYTDGLNLHFYGNAGDFTATLRAHQRFAAGAGRVDLPIWVTECGIETVMPGEVPDAARQRIHGEFMVSTAGQALAFPQVAVFMPFIYAHEGDPNAMTLAPGRPLPAWTRYAEFTKAHPWPSGRVLSKRSKKAGSLVLQWSPDNASCTPFKVSGSYRFVDDKPVRGLLRVCNLGGALAEARLVLTGRVTQGKGAGVQELSREVTLASHAWFELPLEFTPAQAGDRMEVEARLLGKKGELLDQAMFAVEREPSTRLLKPAPLSLSPLPGKSQPQAPLLCVPMNPGPSSGVWTAMNGATVEDLGKGRLRVGVAPGLPDRLRPPFVAASLHKLPRKGFLHLSLDREISPAGQVRVDLIDRHGQRFCIWENFGLGYGERTRELWLSLEDFHVHFFGRCRPEASFVPEHIAEIQIRPYLSAGAKPLELALEWRE